MSSRSTSPKRDSIVKPNGSKRDSTQNDEKTDEKPRKSEKRYQNGWFKEQEQLMAEWSDVAMCYRWLHDNTEKIYHYKTLWINLPVIILSTLSGTANFGISSIFTDDTMKKYASFAIGSVSLFAGILTTIGNYLRYAQLEESHRVASISWGKFQRLIAIELALNPMERMDCMDFLTICRSDLDRLIEQSPPIPKQALLLFEQKFGNTKNLKKPDICGALEHTTIFDSTETRLKQVAVDAAILMRQRRHTLNELVAPQMQMIIQKKVDISIAEALSKKEQDSNNKVLDKVTDRVADRVVDRVSEPRTDFVRNRLLSRPVIHKKEYHSIVIKADEPEKPENVIVIPENPLYSPSVELATLAETIHSDKEPLINSVVMEDMQQVLPQVIPPQIHVLPQVPPQIPDPNPYA